MGMTFACGFEEGTVLPTRNEMAKNFQTRDEYIDFLLKEFPNLDRIDLQDIAIFNKPIVPLILDPDDDAQIMADLRHTNDLIKQYTARYFTNYAPLRWTSASMPETPPKAIKVTQLPIVTGFRTFHIIGDKLQGAYHTIWDSNTLDAVCRCKDSRTNDVRQHLLAPDAECGIYISKVAKSENGAYAGDDVLATVVGWGCGYEHETGYRMEHCRIEQLFIKVTPRRRYRVALEVEFEESSKAEDGSIRVQIPASAIAGFEPLIETTVPSPETIEAIKARYEVPVTLINAPDWQRFKQELITGTEVSDIEIKHNKSIQRPAPTINGTNICSICGARKPMLQDEFICADCQAQGQSVLPSLIKDWDFYDKLGSGTSKLTFNKEG